MSAAKAETVIIYRQVYKHRGREFTAWSYLDGKNAENCGMRFAFSLEGETVAGLPDRADAVRKARERIDQRPAEPGEATPGIGAPQTIQGHPPQQEELSLG